MVVTTAAGVGALLGVADQFVVARPPAQHVVAATTGTRHRGQRIAMDLVGARATIKGVVSSDRRPGHVCRIASQSRTACPGKQLVIAAAAGTRHRAQRVAEQANVRAKHIVPSVDDVTTADGAVHVHGVTGHFIAAFEPVVTTPGAGQQIERVAKELLPGAAARAGDQHVGAPNSPQFMPRVRRRSSRFRCRRRGDRCRLVRSRR